ncbi:MAG TPA: exodeoxyribonuclease VII small subunit [Accumulibacter sp.]|nr:exodeoxyribonuclease VII small subunit [Accumulibacter sp.]HMW17615.1 exodeoxyribonuclease VII small subunit [Accumulibacter sp.]HMX23270.1 exodeoxyribonuclease VII small subunit [Accumulibacter sp.]HMY06227.1 exodeoxyribonuclease VII small subunit [Accumulibacter sp.]HNC17291.1 exodeoxyribonuclease VII small subunit [Accumulibacter sp.]
MPRHKSEPPADSALANSGDPSVAAMTFEAALDELERIVQGMENGRLPLEESLAAYRRGSELLKHCQQCLGNAEQQIQILDNGLLRDFEADNGESR